MTHEELAAIGAFLSGVGSVVSAAWFVRRQRRQASEECDKRLQEYDRALHEGLNIARSDKEQ
jgi:hypothetical protein